MQRHVNIPPALLSEADMEIDINLKRQLDAIFDEKIAKQFRFAAMRAVNQAAFDAKQGTEQAIAQTFDAPTPWISKSVRYVKATKEKLEARVDFDKWGNKNGVTAANVLRAQIFGGGRKHKRFEKALIAAGAMRSDQYAVPGNSVKLDAYGNVPGSLIVEVLSYLSAFRDVGFKSNATAKSRDRKWKGTKARTGYEYFVVQDSSAKLPKGIYKRKNYGGGAAARVAHLARGGAQPVFLFVRQPKYKQTLDFYTLANKIANESFDKNFPALFEQAMKSAR